MSSHRKPAGSMRSGPLLAACLIVKNEEHHLGECLESLDRLGSLVSEVCVYDTGSTDGTVALATARGARVIQGYWGGDFSRARNESLAMTTATWALIVDADETVIADPEVLRKALEHAAEVDVLNANLTHVDEAGRPIGRSSYGAVLKVADVRYVGRIHEVALRMDGATTRVIDLDDDQVTFTHVGYATPQIRRAKAERNAAAAAADVEMAVASGDRGRIAGAQYHHARSVLRLGGPDGGAMEELEEAWQGFEPGSIGRERVLAVLVPELLKRGETAEATGWVRRHLGSGGSPHHGRLLIARIAQASERYDDALIALAGIPESGDPEREVDPRTVLDLRIDVLDALSRSHEALACCLLLVTRWGDLSRLREMLTRVSTHDAESLAGLLTGPAVAVPGPDLVRALRDTGDPFGEQVAGRLLALTG